MPTNSISAIFALRCIFVGILNVTRIKTLREQKHWDQQDLARNAQVARSVISRLERGLQDDFQAFRDHINCARAWCYGG